MKYVDGYLGTYTKAELEKLKPIFKNVVKIMNELDAKTKNPKRRYLMYRGRGSRASTRAIMFRLDQYREWYGEEWFNKQSFEHLVRWAKAKNAQDLPVSVADNVAVYIQTRYS